MGNMQLKSESGRTSTSALAIGLAIGLVAVSLPHLALASSASSGGGLPYESFLKNVTSSISGPVAYAIALLGVAGAGGTLILGGDHVQGEQPRGGRVDRHRGVHLGEG